MHSESNIFPLSIMVYVTNYCEHRCSHCFMTAREQLNTSHIDLNTLLAFLDLARKKKCCMIGIAGGDPFMHPQIEQILRGVF